MRALAVSTAKTVINVRERQYGGSEKTTLVKRWQVSLQERNKKAKFFEGGSHMIEKLGLEETVDVLRFVKSLEFDQLPSEVIQKAKQCILDIIGCALGGAATTEHAKIVIEVMKQLGGEPQATVFADGFKTSTMNAALANGTSGHSHDLDDAHRDSFFHVGVGSIPAVLALAEQHGRNGKEVITATVAAFEVSIRLALAVNPALRLRGYHTTGTCGTFGGAVGASRWTASNH
jgi:2-methylcitrate dehydratase PrpD